MDLVFREYPSPFPLIDGMISCGSFTKWIDKVLAEHEDNILWDLYLHKCFREMSFAQYKESIKNPQEEEIDKKEIETTVKNSYNILQNFNPERG